MAVAKNQVAASPKNLTRLSKETLLEAYKLMVTSRAIDKREKILKKALAIFVAFFLILLLFTAIKISRDSRWQEAVVTTSSVNVYSGPGKEFTLQFTGHEGLEVKIEQKKDDWYLVSLPNGARGWLPTTNLEKI